MLKHLIKTRSIVAIFSFALSLTVPTQTSNADAVSCAQAVAQAAADAAEAEAACSQFGTNSGACILALQKSAESGAAMATQCAQ